MNENLKTLLAELHDGVLTLTLNRPEVRNSLSPESWKDLCAALDLIEERDEVQVVIITGAGEKAFASGADIQSLNQRTYREILNGPAMGILKRIESLSKPVIAAINGFALGGGCELALACDIRVAASTAKFGFPEVSLGLIPGAGGTQRLSRVVGMGVARDLILTGRIIDAQEALRYSLVTRVVEPDALKASALAMAKDLATKGPVALRLAKVALNASLSSSLETGLELERLAMAVLMSTEDRLEGTSAFLEKRPPRFTGT